MQPSSSRGVGAYSALEVETGVTGASPKRLIIMLYDGALRAIFTARAALLQENTAQKGESVSRAIAIVGSGLRQVLDLEAGGEIAANLMALYDYICMRLLYGNIKNEIASFDEAARLLTELRGAWETLEQRDRLPDSVSAPVPASATVMEPTTTAALGKA